MKPAEACPVGEYLADELQARGWLQADLARIIDRPPQAISEIITGKKRMTAETAAQIAAATGTETVTWLRLQAEHEAWVIEQNPPVGLATIRARARAWADTTEEPAEWT